MAWMVVLGLLGCRPDPDVRLHAGDLAGAAAAFETREGRPLDTAHPVAEILAIRARRDPAITTTTIEHAVAAVRRLEQAPLKRSQSLDLSFGSFVDLGAALDAIVVPPALVVVGRAEGVADPDPYTVRTAPLPWKGGRLVGSAESGFEAFGRVIEANPPAKLVTVALSDQTGDVWLSAERRDHAWFVTGASDAEAGARLILAAESVRDYGGATLRAREGGGFVRQ